MRRDAVEEGVKTISDVAAVSVGSIGVITGTIEAGKIPALRRIGGVAEVEEQREIRLPPPDSDLQ